MDKVVRDRRHALVGYAYLVSGSLSEAEEIAQEAIVKTFARGKAKRDVDMAEAYIKRAIVNETINRARHRRVADAKRAVVAEAESMPGHDAAVSAHEDMQQALAELSARERACVILKYFEDLTVDQIARELSLSSGTVKRYLFNAAEKLRDVLGADIDIPDTRELARVSTHSGGN